MRKKSSGTAGVKLLKLNYGGVLRELREYAERTVAKGAKAVILIGSLARGDYTAYSDADVVVIADDVPERPIDRVLEFMDPTLTIDLVPVVYTTKEAVKMAEEGRRVIGEIISYGKLLAGDERLIETLRSKFKDVPCQRGEHLVGNGSE